MFASTARPTLPDVAAAPATGTDAGARIDRTDAIAAKWSRSSIRSSTASVGAISSETVSSPNEVRRRTAKPALSNTPSIGRFSDMTSASNRWIPRSAAIAASCSSIRVPAPRRRQSSATANATSAARGSRSPSNPATATTAPSCRAISATRSAPLASTALVSALTGAPYTSRHATYDLRRLRRKQIIERLPGTHRYRLTPHGRAIAVLFTKTYGRVLTPGLTGLSPGLPSDLARRSPLATAWRQLDRALDQHITAGLAAA